MLSLLLVIVYGHFSHIKDPLDISAIDTLDISTIDNCELVWFPSLERPRLGER